MVSIRNGIRAACALYAVSTAVRPAAERYTGELASDVLGRRAAKLVRAMEEVQDALGEGQDSAVTRQLCLSVGIAASAAGENAWTYGRLHGLEQARADRAERAFWELAPSLPRVLRRAAAKS